MAALIAPGVARYAVNGQYSGRPVVNILDFRIDTTGTTVNRDDAVQDKAGDIIEQWTDHILPLLDDEYTALSVSWVDLDEDDGSTGERSSTDTIEWPENGSQDGAGMPGNAAIRINKNIVARRGQRQGRMYLAGVNESLTTDDAPNQVDPASAANFNTALADFLAEVNDSQVGGFDYVAALGVVHTKDDVFTSFSDVEALVVDQTLGSQRRRLRG